MAMAKLRKMLTHPGKNESGQGVLAIVLILLMLGAVILTPLLVFMSTGVKAGQVYESKLQEFYAADSGVEAAMCEISQNDTNPIVPDYPLNDRNVDVTIEDKGGGFYKIISTATSDTGGNTTVECYVLNIAGFNLFDNAITSNGTVDIKGNVTGNVTAADCEGDPNCNETQINWPSEEQLSTWYLANVNVSAPYSEDHIDIDTDPIIGPLYRNGTLDIYNAGSAGKNATLNGTVYVTGDLKIGKTTGTSNDFTLNLNNQTIFVESASADPQKAIWVSKNVQIVGSGCIIAVGDVYFEPDGDVGSENDFVFIMSIEGTVTLQPGGDFYGSIAGDADVTLQPVNTLIWTASGGRGNFPTEGMGMMIVRSYTIK